MGEHREQTITAATALRAEGLTYREIGARLGVGDQTVWRWLNPERAAAITRRDNARPETRARKRKHDRSIAGRGVCSECGGPKGIASKHRSDTCQSCVEARVGRVVAVVVAGYREGLTAYEIAEKTGIPKNTIIDEAYRLRLAGVAVPRGPTGATAHRKNRRDLRNAGL